MGTHPAQGPTKKPAICFVSPRAYPGLSERTDLEHIGGAEIHQIIVAKELARRGYKVSFVTLDYGQQNGALHDGIRVHKTYSPDSGVPGIRFFHPRLTGLWRAMSRADADVYYQQNAGTLTGRVAAWCRLRRRRFIYAVAADPDCQRTLWRLGKKHERALYCYGLRNADCIVSQTIVQQTLLWKEFKMSSTVVRCCTTDPGPSEHDLTAKTRNPRLLWLGRITEQKGLDHLLDLAVMCPDFQIDIVGGGNTGTSSYEERILSRAKEIPNITLHGYVPFALVDRYYAMASALVCTSDWEGYPSTFMEAWSRGIPVVTRWDTDGVVSENGVGIVESDTRMLAVKIRELVASPSEWLEASRRARDFFLKNHTVESTADQYERIFQRWFDYE
ncbi:MAG: glycosyltransferase family 4 protein [bacterium]